MLCAGAVGANSISIRRQPRHREAGPVASATQFTSAGPQHWPQLQPDIRHVQRDVIPTDFNVGGLESAGRGECGR